MINIIEVSTKKQLRAFVKFPERLYKDNPYYVPRLTIDELSTLNPQKNPASEHCESKLWLAVKNGDVVGRIAAIVNYRYIQKWGLKNGRFGYLDFIEDFNVAKALLESAQNWLKSLGMERIHGPLGFCDLDPEGMLIDGFNIPATFTTTYNYKYYPSFMERLGYKKDADWYEYEITIPSTPPPILNKISTRVLKSHNLQILDFENKRDLMPYVPKVFQLINSSYSDLYAVTELTEKQIDYYAKQYIIFFSKDFVKLVIDKNDNLVAFGLALPSLAKAMQKCRGHLFPFGFLHLLIALRQNDRAELLLIAVDKKYQKTGVNAVILNSIAQNPRYNISKADLNPQLESNLAVRGQWRYFDSVHNKTRRCYIKEL